MAKELKVGILTVITVLVFYYGFNFLKGIDFFTPTHRYFAIYNKVDGMVIGNSIKINGLAVGRVSNIQILQSQKNQILVSLDIDDGIILNDSSLALLADNGMLGEKMIDLKIRRGTRNLKHLDTLLAGSAGGMLAKISNSAGPMLTKADALLENINLMLLEYKGMGAKMQTLTQNASEMSGTANTLLKANEAKIGQITTNLAQISADLNQMTTELKPMPQKMNQLADKMNALELEQTVKNAQKTLAELNKMLTAINQKQGSAGKLVYDDSLYNNLNQTLTDLDAILVEFQQKPKKYIPNVSVFGGKKKDKKNKE